MQQVIYPQSVTIRKQIDLAQTMLLPPNEERYFASLLVLRYPSLFGIGSIIVLILMSTHRENIIKVKFINHKVMFSWTFRVVFTSLSHSMNLTFKSPCQLSSTELLGMRCCKRYGILMIVFRLHSRGSTLSSSKFLLMRMWFSPSSTQEQP